MKRSRYQYLCSNCGKNGHVYKECTQPITSYGVILVSIENEKNIDYLSNKINNDYNKYNHGIILKKSDDILTFCNIKNNVKFLLVQRKHTLGYIEFIRGRYNIDDADGIIILFKQMTPKEIKKLSENEFEILWNDVWLEKRMMYQAEFNLSKKKFDKLKNPNKECLGLSFYAKNVDPVWTQPEWGFPKGRRSGKENDIECAVREFREESSLKTDEFQILPNFMPIEERLTGTNGVYYKHIYYVGLSNTDAVQNVKMDPTNNHQLEEIGNIGLFTFEEAIKLIRPYHIEKRKILTQLYLYVMNNLLIMTKKFN
jgi:8-oxo-dGTP pyrophosphatase MutT (NUDIX family)